MSPRMTQQLGPLSRDEATEWPFYLDLLSNWGHFQAPKQLTCHFVYVAGNSWNAILSKDQTETPFCARDRFWNIWIHESQHNGTGELKFQVNCRTNACRKYISHPSESFKISGVLDRPSSCWSSGTATDYRQQPSTITNCSDLIING